MRPAYYNEIDPYAAQWIRNLIASGLVSAGDVDERDIRDVRPSDLAGYTRCHFFAGIGGWDLALALAGWPADRPVWTGSCPCQPFSAAGRRAGFDDERHLWPVWFDLIRQCRPAVVLGEQVEAAVRLGWLDAVFSDLEGQDYACGAAVLGAHSVGAPHIRQRLWFVADADGEHGDRRRRGPGDDCWQLTEQAQVRRGEQILRHVAEPAGSRSSRRKSASRAAGRPSAETSSAIGVAMGDAISPRLEGGDARALGDERAAAERAGAAGGVGYADGFGETPERGFSAGTDTQRERSSWAPAEWLPCRDGKSRPTQPGLQPLAHGIPARVGKLRAAGNAIVPQAAAAFIGAALDALPLFAAE